MTNAPAERLIYLDYFRALAIFQVVALHAMGALINKGYDTAIAETDPVVALNYVLFHNATIYFTLISGVLYAFLFANRDIYAFVHKRLLYVALPYVIVTSALMVLLSVRQFQVYSTFSLSQLFNSIVENVLNGDAWSNLWYMPVIIALYAITPVLMAMVQSRNAWTTIAVTMLLPLIIWRTGTTVSFGTFIYFLGPYVIGLAMGADLERWMNWLSSHLLVLVVVAVSTSIALFFMGTGNFTSVHAEFVREILFYIQKLALAFVFLIGLRFVTQKTSPRSNAFFAHGSKTAFALYLIHGPIIRPLAKAVGHLTPRQPPGGLMLQLSSLAIGIVTILVAWGLIALLQKLLKERSRLVIGI